MKTQRFVAPTKREAIEAVRRYLGSEAVILSDRRTPAGIELTASTDGEAIARSAEAATRVHAWVYGFNTIGAFAGALAAAFILIPTLGLDGALSLSRSRPDM